MHTQPYQWYSQTSYFSATADTVLPLSKPVYTTDGNVMESIPVPKGSQYLVGFLGCNMSKAMWGKDAPEWKPERWLSPLPSTLTESRVPGVYSNLCVSCNVHT